MRLGWLCASSFLSCLALACGESGDPGGPGGANGSGGEVSSSGGADGAGGGSSDSGGSGGASPSGGGPAVEPDDPAGTWRSALYPRGWLPLEEGGTADDQGRYLQDYSYAGYHQGLQRPPHGEGAISVTVDAALGNGSTNATSAIQSAIDSTCAGGGGVVFLPAGTYRVALPSAGAGEALAITCSHLVLRGAGPAQTRILFDDAARARQKSVIAFRSAAGGGVWDPVGGTNAHAFSSDALSPTLTVSLGDVGGLAVGDWVTVRNDNTNAFRGEHRMDAANTGEGDYWPANSFRGLFYTRRIVAITGNDVTLDAPTRYALRTRDAARLIEIGTFIEESGIESLSIGMVQNNASSLTSGGEASHDEEYNTAGTTPYQVHASAAISLSLTHDSWLYDVDTFAPSQNSSGAHVLANGIVIGMSAFRLHVEKCDFGRPQYRGGGGNGYLFHVQGNDNLFVDSTTANARHGYIFNQAVSGNVFLRGKSSNSRLSDDSHRFLAHANLHDGLVLDGSFLQGVNRGTTSTGGGFTSTQHVYWNTQVTKNHGAAQGCAVESAQYGWGYLIGSSSSDSATALLCPRSFSNGYWAGLDDGQPDDIVEGEEEGATLWPTSLYESQLARRCARQGLTCQ
ncbi:MAG TPA: glycosyl hydrolase family 28-related protein [Polyangiaceae bacterium]|nr:glycosyl hydrolase family 28-related protein [Polyangiaceae bacterium]